MAMYLEFVVPGPPISNQQSTPAGKANLVSWQRVIAGAVVPLWGTKPILTGELKAVIINFFVGKKPSVDVDNMSKPILDEMQKIVYKDDRQIRQAEITHTNIGSAFQIAGVSNILVNSINAGKPFVYVRIEDIVNPFPLPK